MTFSWDFNTATLIAIVLNFVGVIVFLVRTDGKAKAAYDLAEKAQDRMDNLDDRLRKVENENVLGVALRQDFKEFQALIGKQFNDLRNERREDMRGLHSRLNDIIMVPPRAD